MALPYTIVDAFTDRPFAGNPAAVYLLEAPRPAEWMQLVAREMNLSETAFLVPEGDGLRLRWFTPAAEVKLCGHATLASAHVLWETGRSAYDHAVRFFTLSGELRAARDGAWITLDFPARPGTPTTPPPGLAEALGTTIVGIWSSAEDLLVELASASAVRAAVPNISALRQLPVRGIIITAPGDEPGIDFVSRFFAPRMGVAEDPVTGSAHTVLAPFWAARLEKPELVGYQASARGGIVRVRAAGERVLLSGHAVTVAHAELLVD